MTGDLNTARVESLWRYPVKSLQGESLGAVVVERDGMQGDRSWGIRDEPTGRILTARREPNLLLASAVLDPDGEPAITLPTGQACAGVGPRTDAALSDWLGRPVRLVPAAHTGAARAEFFADATDDTSEAIEWTMPAGRFVDTLPLLLLTTASLRAAARLHPAGTWDVRRFRPNILLQVQDDGWVEDQWCDGRAVRVGGAVLAPDQPCARCTMVTRPQPGLGEDRDIFRTLARHHRGTLGVWSAVRTPGEVRVGDILT